MDFVVHGEASETDEENGNDTRKIAVLAAEVKGEATESDSSDEEIYEKSLSQNSKDSIGNAFNRSNLLQRKLIDNNVCIWRTLKNVIKQLVVPASKQVFITDQLLIKSQVSMQSVCVSLKSSHSNIKELRDRAGNLMTAKFIPEIENIPVVTNTDKA